MADWSKLKVVDLKAELKKRDLPQNGLKAELVARLDAADQDGAASEAQIESNVEEDGPVEEEQPAADVEQQEAPVEAKGTEEKATSELAPASEDRPATPEQSAEGAVEETLPSAPAQETTGVPPAMETSAVGNATVDASMPEAEPEPTRGEEGLPLPAPEEKVLTPEPEETAAPEPKPMDTDEHKDTPKRKRTESPPPDEEVLAKRARMDSVSRDIATAPDVDMDKLPQEKGRHMEDDRGYREDKTVDDADEMDIDTSVSPSIHLATPALYISNLMRPLRPADMQSYLESIAGTSSSDSSSIIKTFHLDQIRTHAFVVFSSISQAARVRSKLHDKVWPNESNRKALFVDFVPPEKVDSWIDTETASGGRAGARWEVNYTKGPDGEMIATHESSTASLSRPSVPPPPSSSVPTGPRRLQPSSTNAVPLGPRAGPSRDTGGPSFANAPTGPRPKRPGGPGPFPPAQPLEEFTSTRSSPSIQYAPVAPNLARRRIDNMRSYYTSERGPYGRDINRYSFEDGDVFVDRGKEVFEGIRPPHRERGGGGMRGGRRGGGGGGRRNRNRGDRYMPGGGDRDRGGPGMRYDDRR